MKEEKEDFLVEDISIPILLNVPKTVRKKIFLIEKLVIVGLLNRLPGGAPIGKIEYIRIDN